MKPLLWSESAETIDTNMSFI